MAKPMSGKSDREGGMVSVGDVVTDEIGASCNLCHHYDEARPTQTLTFDTPMGQNIIVLRLCDEHLRLTGEVITVSQEGR
jgi:hypothetical protein